MSCFGEAANFKCFQVRINCPDSLCLRYRSRENDNSVAVSSNAYGKSKISMEHLWTSNDIDTHSPGKNPSLVLGTPTRGMSMK